MSPLAAARATMMFLLAKITEILTEKDSLTIPEVQHSLKAKYGVMVPQRRIAAVIAKNGNILDAVYKHGQIMVAITTKYREQLASNDENTKKG
jgi:hypothetical protein